MDKYSYISRNCNVVNTDIGAFCSIGSNCAIGGGLHPTETFSSSPVFYDKNNGFGVTSLICEDLSNFDAEPKTTIGNDVWIGENVFVKAGVTIGNGAIIGALAVVTKDVPPYAIMGGVPAKVIRYRFPEKTIEKLLKLKWWSKTDAEIKELMPELKRITKQL